MKPGTRQDVDAPKPDTPEAAARCAAFWLVEVDNKSFMAAEAVEESERVITLAEESEIKLEAVKEFCKQYNR